jgi:hypothetical protein
LQASGLRAYNTATKETRMFDRQQSIGEAQAVDLSSNDQPMQANRPTRSVYVGTGGTLIVELVNNPGTPVTYKIPSGVSRPLRVSKFIKIGTTAMDIVAEF